jgi:hypothetical protein
MKNDLESDARQAIRPRRKTSFPAWRLFQYKAGDGVVKKFWNGSVKPPSEPR